MKVFICPRCGWIREVSRRKKVECFKCGYGHMVQAKLSYEQYVQMDMEARQDYVKSWLYIHKT